MDMLSEISQLKADYTAAQSLLEEAKDAKASFDTQLADKEAALVAANEQAAATEQSLAESKQSLAAIQAELAELKASQKTAEEKAVDIAASQGIKPMKADYSAESEVKDKADVIAALNAIKDPVARANYYFANKAVLFGA